jgi:uncharacterized membrane protein YphA (DoxX/SURF4 family)
LAADAKIGRGFIGLPDMIDSRRYLSTFAVVALVLMRLVIGWHFWGEGTKKIEYDRHDGRLKLVFSAEGFLAAATGPLAQLYHAQAPGNHGVRQLVSVSRQNTPPSADEIAKRSQWQAEYNRRRAEAAKGGAEAPIEFAPHAPYHAWATQIADDWRAVLDDVKAIAGLSEAQRAQADAAYQARLQELADYLVAQTDAITEYQHELWRLENWRSAPEARDVPFHDERIATKAAETSSPPNAWVNQVREIEAAYLNDLRNILTTEQRGLALTTAAIDDALTDSRQDTLRIVNIAVTAVTIGVGVCLLLGFFTRLASIVGALFLLAVIASQPPWLAESEATMPQCIEFAALLVLAGTGAGRWAGLDYFTYALFHRDRDAEA